MVFVFRNVLLSSGARVTDVGDNAFGMLNRRWTLTQIDVSSDGQDGRFGGWGEGDIRSNGQGPGYGQGANSCCNGGSGANFGGKVPTSQDGKIGGPRYGSEYLLPWRGDGGSGGVGGGNWEGDGCSAGGAGEGAIVLASGGEIGLQNQDFGKRIAANLLRQKGWRRFWRSYYGVQRSSVDN